MTKLFAVRIWAVALSLGWAALTSAVSDDPAPRPVYELRIYHSNPGKLDRLQARFRDHTRDLFKKHGMTNVIYLVPVDEAKGRDNTLVYVLAHESREAAKASWDAFRADPEWQKAKAASEADGTPLVERVDAIFLDATDYSPDPLNLEATDAPRVFELRTYTASPGKLDSLNKRFRDHTTALFQAHGMTNVLYGVPQDKEQGHENKLIYLLAFPSREAAAKSWKAFGDDPKWQRVYKESQPDNVPLAAKVESLFLTPTGYSPIH